MLKLETIPKGIEEIVAVYGAAGRILDGKFKIDPDWFTENVKVFALSFPLRQSWDSREIRTFHAHRKVGAVMVDALEEIAGFYGLRLMRRHGLDFWGGVYNLRGAITGEENQLKLAQLMTTLAEARLQISLAEAQSQRFFVAGWRPFIGWVIGCSMAMKYIVGPIITTYTKLPFPDLDFGMMYSLLQILLGAELVGARTFEKLKGVQDKH